MFCRERIAEAAAPEQDFLAPIRSLQAWVKLRHVPAPTRQHAGQPPLPQQGPTGGDLQGEEAAGHRTSIFPCHLAQGCGWDTIGSSRPPEWHLALIFLASKTPSPVRPIILLPHLPQTPRDARWLGDGGHGMAFPLPPVFPLLLMWEKWELSAECWRWPRQGWR